MSDALQQPFTGESSPFEHGAHLYPITEDSMAGIGNEGLSQEETCFPTKDPVLIHAARQLTATEYLRRGFVTQDQIGEDGTILHEHDPYKDHSTYFVKLTPEGEVAATLRVINYDPAKGKKSFPILDHESELEESYVEKLKVIGTENLLEVSALVRSKELDKDGSAALQLYRQMMIDSWANDKTGKGTLIMACNPVLYENFRLLFDGSMQRIGPDLDLPGQEAIPAMLELTDGSINVADISRDKKNPYNKLHKTVIEYFFAGTDANKINPQIVDALDANAYTDLTRRMRENDWSDLGNIDASIQSKLTRAAVPGKIREKAKKYRPEIAANVLLAGYTALRTVGVAQGVDPVSDTNWETFLAIELGTQVPYTWGISDLIRGGLKDEYPRSRKMLASTAVGSAFIAPYAYVAAEGGAENLQAAGVTGVMLGVGLYFLSGQIKKIKEVRSKHKSATNLEA